MNKIATCCALTFNIACNSCENTASNHREIEPANYMDNLGNAVSWPKRQDYRDNKFWMSKTEMNRLIILATNGDSAALHRIINFWSYVINDPENRARWAIFSAQGSSKIGKLAMYSGLKNDDVKTRFVFKKKFTALKSFIQDVEQMVEDDYNPLDGVQQE